MRDNKMVANIKIDSTAQIITGLAIFGAVGVVGFLAYKLIKPVGQTLSKVGDSLAGVTQGVSTATGGVGQGIKDVAGGTAGLVVKLETSTGDTASKLINSGGNLADTQLTGATVVTNTGWQGVNSILGIPLQTINYAKDITGNVYKQSIESQKKDLELFSKIGDKTRGTIANWLHVG